MSSGQEWPAAVLTLLPALLWTVPPSPEPPRAPLTEATSLPTPSPLLQQSPLLSQVPPQFQGASQPPPGGGARSPSPLYPQHTV